MTIPRVGPAACGRGDRHRVGDSTHSQLATVVLGVCQRDPAWPGVSVLSSPRTVPLTSQDGSFVPCSSCPGTLFLDLREKNSY